MPTTDVHLRPTVNRMNEALERRGLFLNPLSSHTIVGAVTPPVHMTRGEDTDPFITLHACG